MIALIIETDFDDRTLTYEHDAVGRLTFRTNALGQVVSFERDALGQVLRKNAACDVTTYAYDMTDQLAQATGPDGMTLTILRDRFGLVRSETVDDRKLTYTHDDLGRRTGRTTPTGATTTGTYDAAGRRTGMVAAGPRTSPANSEETTMADITWEDPFCAEGSACFRLGTDTTGNAYIAMAGAEDDYLTDTREGLRTHPRHQGWQGGSPAVKLRMP